MSEKRHTPKLPASLEYDGSSGWRLDRVPRKTGTGTMRADFRRCHTRSQELTKTCTEKNCLQRLLSDQRCDKCIYVRATHKDEGQDVHCRQWFFSACVGSKCSPRKRKDDQKKRSHLAIQTANGIVRSTEEQRFTSKNWWAIFLWYYCHV